MKKKCYTYKRVSTISQVDGYSLEAQSERLREYAEYRGIEIAGEYCDAGRSGKSVKGRPEFMRMMEDIMSQKDGVSFVLVFKLSRFGRNAADVLKSMQLLADYGVDLICVEDAIDSSTQGGRLTLAILSAVAEIEKENISIQFLAGKMQKLNAGGWPGGPIPYGYRNENRMLVVEPEEAQVVRMVYDLYLQEGKGIHSVVNYLNANGYKKRFRGTDMSFTSDTVKAILDNPVYCGRILYNRRSVVRPGAERKEIVSVKGIHEPLVTQEQWEAVKKKRESRSVRNKRSEDPERISLLSGLVKCPVCGSGMVMKRYKNINHNHGGYYKTLYYYGCSKNLKANGRVCSFNHVYNQKKVDAAVYEIVGRLQMLPEFRQKVENFLGTREEMDLLESELKNIRKRLRSEEMRKWKLGDDLDSLDIFDDGYDRKYDEIQASIDRAYDKIETIESELARKERKLSALKQGVRSADKIGMLLDHMMNLYEHMSCAEKRKMYRLFIEKIEVFPDHQDGRVIKSIVFKFPVYYKEDITADSEPDEEISFTLDCSGMEKTAAESKATYVQIRAYILERFGVKVSSLYIAQIKRKYGLDMGDCYRRSENPDAKVPQCPKVKEGYILEVLKHYKMLGTDVEMKE